MYLGKPRGMTGKKHSSETKLKISKAKMGQVGFWKGKKLSLNACEALRKAHLGKKLSEEHKRKIGISNKGKHSYVVAEEMKNHLRKTTLAWFKTNPKFGETSIEKILYKELEDRKIEFEKQAIINKRFLVDAYIPSKNLIIEADGGFWHSIPRVMKKDKAENAYLVKCGYQLLRLPEKEILDGSFRDKI